MRILLTGFKPFGGMKTNPSEIIANNVLKEQDNISIVRAILPVHFREASLKLIDLIKVNQNFDFLLMLGVDLGKPNIEIESTARYISKYYDKDYMNDFQLEIPAEYVTSVPIEKIRKVLASQHNRIVISDDTGGYVCNHVYYLAQHLIFQYSLDIPALFVHIPYPYPYYINRKKVNPNWNINQIQISISNLITEINRIYQIKNT